MGLSVHHHCDGMVTAMGDLDLPYVKGMTGMVFRSDLDAASDLLDLAIRIGDHSLMPQLITFITNVSKSQFLAAFFFARHSKSDSEFHHEKGKFQAARTALGLFPVLSCTQIPNTEHLSRIPM